jgi:hypothetical protein
MILCFWVRYLPPFRRRKAKGWGTELVQDHAVGNLDSFPNPESNKLAVFKACGHAVLRGAGRVRAVFRHFEETRRRGHLESEAKPGSRLIVRSKIEFRISERFEGCRLLLEPATRRLKGLSRDSYIESGL